MIYSFFINYILVYERIADRFRGIYGEEALIEWKKLSRRWATEKEQKRKQKEMEKQRALEREGLPRKV